MAESNYFSLTITSQINFRSLLYRSAGEKASHILAKKSEIVIKVNYKGAKSLVSSKKTMPRIQFDWKSQFLCGKLNLSILGIRNTNLKLNCIKLD
jgi:hypothetical protein